jgi:site-specific recombinase XerC
MFLTDAIESYLLYARHEQRVARRTYLTYTSWLRHFLDWITTNGYETPTLEDLNPLVLRRYLYSLSEKGLRPRSVRSCFYPIRSMCSYLVKSGTMQANPVLQ